MDNKQEFIKEYRYIKNLIKKLNSVAEILNIDSDEPFGPIIDHHVKLLAKAFNISENNIDILWEMLYTGYVQIAIYNDNNQLCKIIPVTETNLYEELIGTKNQNDIIKLKDEDSMHTHVFCPSCHYWLLGEDVGVNYCPHCGIKLFWNSEKISKVHESWHEMSIERYNQLKNNIKNTKKDSKNAE